MKSKERVKVMHDVLGKRTRKLLVDREFYASVFSDTFIFGGVLSILTQSIFTIVFEWNWLVVEIGTLFFALFVVIGDFALTNVFSKDSPYDEEILREERRMRQQEVAEGYTYLNRLEQVTNKFNASTEHQNIFEIAKKTEMLVLKLMQEGGLHGEEYHFIQKTLPNDLSNTLELFCKLTPDNQKEMNQQIYQVFNEQYEELENRFVNDKQVSIKTEINKQIALIKTREY